MKLSCPYSYASIAVLTFAIILPQAFAEPPPKTGLASFGMIAPGLGLTPSDKSSLTYGGHEQPEATGVRQHRLSISTPVYRGESESLSATLNGGILHLDRPVLLEKTNTQIPDDLYRSELTLQYARKLENERHWGARVSLGYANDKPFNGWRDTAMSFTGSYAYPGTEKSYWVLTMFASNNSSFVPNYVPIPGFLYLFKGEKFSGMFGLPVSVFQWRPVEPWMLAFSLFGTNVSTDLNYGSFSAIQYFVGASWTHQSYMRADRLQQKDRLYISEKRFYAGIKTPVFIPISGELQIGQAFDRTIGEGTSTFRKENGSADLNPSWFLSWNFRYVF